MTTVVQQVTVKQSEYGRYAFLRQENQNQQNTSASYLDLFTSNHVNNVLQDAVGYKNIPFDKASKALFNKQLTGEVIKSWEFQTGGDVESPPCIGSDGTVYVGSYDGNLYAIGADGKEKWRFKTGDWGNSSPCIGSDGTVYVGSYDGSIYALLDKDIFINKSFNEPDNNSGGNTDPKITFGDEWVMVGSTQIQVTK